LHVTGQTSLLALILLGMSLMPPPPLHISRIEVARQLDAVGELLARQGANPFQARAYHSAAATVRALPSPLAELIDREGQLGLEQLPNIGPGIARAILELAQTGRLRMLDRLEGEMCPERLLSSIPSVGPTLAKRIHEQLGTSTLEDLEIAANDGRLASVNGFGARRVAAVRDVLDATLRRARRRSGAAPRHEPPPVARLLALDARYRAQAERNELPLIKPRRFNPEQVAWLPVLHTNEEGDHVTVLYSNSALAHRLGKTRDWVVLYFDGDGRDREYQATVVTETSGVLRGLRVVRGREAECREHYARQAPRARGAEGHTEKRAG